MVGDVHAEPCKKRHEIEKIDFPVEVIQPAAGIVSGLAKGVILCAFERRHWDPTRWKDVE